MDEHSEAQVFPAFDGGPWGRLNRRATTRVAPRGEATRKFADSFQVEHISAAGTCSKRRSSEGFYLGTFARQTGFDAHGIDISIPAIDAAARRYPGCEWIVGNADRFVPYADRSFSIVMSDQLEAEQALQSKRPLYPNRISQVTGE